MASSMAKNMEKKLYAMINCLADNYGFNVDEAFEYARWETDVDHVGEILKMVGVEEKKVEKTEKVEADETASVAPTESSAGGDIAEKIAACKKNISTWQTKLDKGTCKDADKQREKIAKENAKLAKLEAKAGSGVPSNGAPAPAAKVEEKKPEAKKEEKEKRIKRFSPVMGSQLKKALEDVGVEMSDKLKKEFQQYVEDLTDDDFRATGLADHMRAFAKLKTPAPASATESESDNEVDELVKEIDALTVEEAPSSNAVGGGPKVVEVSIEELRAISMTATLDDMPDTLWDAEKGRFVKGPDSDEDEDVVETKFNNKDYVVGEKTGRVYEVRESGDVFAGFAGVGKFKGLSVA